MTKILHATTCILLTELSANQLFQVEHILQQLEDDYRATVLAHLATLGQDIPPGVDPLDIQLPEELDIESSDAGQ